MKLSTVVLVNKENYSHLFSCLQSVIFSDEIILVIDEEKKVDQKKIDDFFKKNHFSHYRVFFRKLDSFSNQRNFSLEKASNQWVLFVDDDEIVSSRLKKEIEELPEDNLYNCFFIRRRDFFWEKELRFGELKKVYQKGLVRLVKKGTGQWIRKVHEEFFSKKSKVGRLNNFLDHYPHENIKEFLKKINFYSSLRAEELYQEGKRANLFTIISYPFGKFIYTYFLKLGFLDGVAGFVYSFMLSFYSFLVRSKLYLLNLKNQ